MKKYRVFRREVWVQAVIVEADNPNNAVIRVIKGEGACEETDGAFEFSHVLDTDYLAAEPVE